ncbi:Protein phosphatase 1 regulatory subunit 3E [Chytridiales sp. JEL 0842]|nr:Protein phosphatase 1 regulatory subunit 3E [Chytridiales sp. JEL 0842]
MRYLKEVVSLTKMAFSVQLLSTVSQHDISSNSDGTTAPLSSSPTLQLKPILRKSTLRHDSEETLVTREMEAQEETTNIHHSFSAPTLHDHPSIHRDPRSSSSPSLKSIKFDSSMATCVYWAPKSQAKVSRSPNFISDSEVSPSSQKIVGVLAPSRSALFQGDESDESLSYLSSSGSDTESGQHQSSGSEDSASLWMKDNRTMAQRVLEKRRGTESRHDWGEAKAAGYMDLLNGGAKGESWVSIEKVLASSKEPLPWRLTSFSSSTASRLAAGAIVAFDTIQPPPPVSTESQPFLTGTILVRNLCYEKHVMIRWTSDEWASYNDTPATFARLVNTGYNGSPCVDQFSFNLPLSVMGRDNRYLSVKFEFAVMVSMGGRCEWDNNGGRNHFASATCVPKPAVLPSKAVVAAKLKRAAMMWQAMAREAKRIEREFEEGRRVMEESKASISGKEEEVKSVKRLTEEDWEEICSSRSRGGGWGWEATIRAELQKITKVPPKSIVVESPTSPVTTLPATLILSTAPAATTSVNSTEKADVAVVESKPKLRKSPSSSSFSTLTAPPHATTPQLQPPPPPSSALVTPPLTAQTTTPRTTPTPESYGFYAHSGTHPPSPP